MVQLDSCQDINSSSHGSGFDDNGVSGEGIEEFEGNLEISGRGASKHPK